MGRRIVRNSYGGPRGTGNPGESRNALDESLKAPSVGCLVFGTASPGAGKGVPTTHEVTEYGGWENRDQTASWAYKFPVPWWRLG